MNICCRPPLRGAASGNGDRRNSLRSQPASVSSRSATARSRPAPQWTTSRRPLAVSTRSRPRTRREAVALRRQAGVRVAAGHVAEAVGAGAARQPVAPGPPASASAPAPPDRRSLPAAPSSVSRPARPAIRSLPGPPSMQSAPGPPLMRSSPSSPNILVLEAVAVRVSDALVPLIRVVHGRAPLAPADSRLPPATRDGERRQREQNRISSHVRRAPERSCRLVDG